MLERIRLYGRLAARFFEARSRQEREERAFHAFALACVVLVALVKYVTGLTPGDAPFTLFGVAIAASAARGGFRPALVAVLASLLVGGLGAAPGPGERLLFAAEGLLVGLVVATLRSRLLAREERLTAALGTIGELRGRDARRRLLDAALRHLEDGDGEAAIVVVDEGGIIREWRASAERLYGYPAERLLGASGAVLFEQPLSADQWWDMLRQSERAGAFSLLATHRRQDGGLVEVQLEIRPFHEIDATAFTVIVHDQARGREWDAYRVAASRAQSALQQAADDTRRQLAALEGLTDPSLNPLEGPAMVAELLERLRAAIAADGTALVRPAGLGAGLVAACGLQPDARPAGGESLRLAPGRVAVVHNDPARVAQLSSLRWPAAMASLLVVPVVHDGRVWSTIEVVSQRPRPVNDWDVALVRVVADRLAAVVVQDQGLAA